MFPFENVHTLSYSTPKTDQQIGVFKNNYYCAEISSFQLRKVNDRIRTSHPSGFTFWSSGEKAWFLTYWNNTPWWRVQLLLKMDVGRTYELSDGRMDVVEHAWYNIELTTRVGTSTRKNLVWTTGT